MLRASEARARSENPNLYNTFELIKDACKWGNRSTVINKGYLNEENRKTLIELGYEIFMHSSGLIIQW